MSRVALKDPYRESRIFASRTLVVIVGVMVLLTVILVRYFSLQISQYELYRTESEKNRVQLQPLPPTRGLIYDRNGVLLAANRPSYLLSIVVERVADLPQTLDELAELLPISDYDLKKFNARVKRRRPYEAVPLRFKLTAQERARLAVNRYRLAGTLVEAQLVRQYPQGELFSHALGYVGRINEQEQQQLDAVNYSATHYTGKIGLEKYYEDLLHGKVGYQNVETNALGRVLRVLDKHDPSRGANLTLYLDAVVQKAAYEALAGRRGAVVAIDPTTGGVLALVSTPGFDSNLFVNGISGADYGALLDSADLPLFNRAIQGQYPPGSTIKPIIGLAGLEAGTITAQSTIRDPGWYRLPNDTRRYRDWTLRVRGTGHGPAVDLFQAIEQSCDVYFYDLAYHLGVDAIHDFASPFGLGSLTGIDTTHEQQGILPSRAWKRAARAQPWFPGETLSIGIGQGYMLTTPLQLAVAVATIATRGVRYRPRLLHLVEGRPVETQVVVSRVSAGAANWDLIHDAMRAVMHSKNGSARAAGRGLKYTMAGKSGTAQVIGIKQDEEYDVDKVAERHRDHGLFIAFAPLEQPTIAVAVVVENGGGGSRQAAPIARKVLDSYLLRGEPG